jgi:hypothetical protein
MNGDSSQSEVSFMLFGLKEKEEFEAHSVPPTSGTNSICLTSGT